tara:strand:+ start:357 stop:611 length:255 start_codon:yes stop_codon:yes gene_type:complete
MKFKTIVKQKSFWKSVFWLSLSFLVLYNVITIFFEYGSLDFNAFFEERIGEGKLIKFLIGQLLAAFLYGFILAFGQFRGKEKKD